MASDEGGLGSPGEFLPTFFVLLLFAGCWGAVQYHDGSPFLGAVLAAPLAAGMMSAATARMIFGRNRGGVAAVFGVGVVLFLVMLGVSTFAGKLGAPEGIPFVLDQEGLLMAGAVGLVGSLLGSLSLAHYLSTGPSEPDEDTDDLPEEDDEDIDYSTQPEELVCLLTNQVINPDHDEYIVCHNGFNAGQVCHAVYLKAYTHLLEGRCRRCYQGLRERDLEGMQ